MKKRYCLKINMIKVLTYMMNALMFIINNIISLFITMLEYIFMPVDNMFCFNYQMYIDPTSRPLAIF